MLLISLLLAHILADFYFQPKAWLDSRRAEHWRSTGLAKHALVHLGLTLVALWVNLGGISPALLTALAAIVLSHYVIDLWKSFRPPTLSYFLLDQLLHLMVLITVAAMLSGLSTDALWALLAPLISPKGLLIAAGLLLCGRPMGFIIRMALGRYTDQLVTQQGEGLNLAGQWIGYWERWLVLSFVLLDMLAGVGFLMAAKSVFRVGDLSRTRDRMLTEYMLLGTLMSVALALGCGFAIKALW